MDHVDEALRHAWLAWNIASVRLSAEWTCTAHHVGDVEHHVAGARADAETAKNLAAHLGLSELLREEIEVAKRAAQEAEKLVEPMREKWRRGG